MSPQSSHFIYIIISYIIILSSFPVPTRVCMYIGYRDRESALRAFVCVCVCARARHLLIYRHDDVDGN